MSDDLEMRIINDLVKFESEPEPTPTEHFTAEDLRTSEIPYRRDTKKRHRRHHVRGEQFTKNSIRAVYQRPDQLQAAHDRNPSPIWTPGQGENTSRL